MADRTRTGHPPFADRRVPGTCRVSGTAAGASAVVTPPRDGRVRQSIRVGALSVPSPVKLHMDGAITCAGLDQPAHW